MLDLLVDIPSWLRRGITNPEAMKRLEQALLEAGKPHRNGKAMVHQAPSGPQHEYYRPWYERLLAKGCSRCGGQPQGWVQQQIATPYRFKRFVLWTVNLAPRGAELLKVVLSRRVSDEQIAERGTKCENCPGAMVKGQWTPGRLVQLRVMNGTMQETSFCNLCTCPTWRMPRWLRWLWDVGAHLGYKNTKDGWKCPLRLHDGSNPDMVYEEYRRSKQAESVTEAPGIIK